MSIDAFVADLVRWEGCTTWMYVCTAGRVTCAIGHMMPNVSAAQSLPWHHAGTSRAATPSEVAAAYAACMAMGPGRPARAYLPASGLRLAQVVVDQLTRRRLEREFLPGLRTLVDGFDELPEPAQAVLVDMAWNLGLTGLGKFSRMLAAVGKRDWEAAARACSVKTSRPERNAWRAERFRAAA